MKAARPADRTSYKRVLLGVYYLAEPNGFFCFASDQDIAIVSGLSVSTVRRAIIEMKANGDLYQPERPSRSSPRALVLTDHERYEFYREWWEEHWGPLHTQCLMNQAARREAENQAASDQAEPEPTSEATPESEANALNRAFRQGWFLCQN